jgi:hypothetical protein
LAGETEVFGENLFQLHFVHHKSQLTEPGPPLWEASDYGAATFQALMFSCESEGS